MEDGKRGFVCNSSSSLTRETDARQHRRRILPFSTKMADKVSDKGSPGLRLRFSVSTVVVLSSTFRLNPYPKTADAPWRYYLGSK